MEYVHTGTRSLADNKNSDALVLKFFLQLFLSDSEETTLAGELCRKTRRQSTDPKVAADLRQARTEMTGHQIECAPQVFFSTQVLISAGFY